MRYKTLGGTGLLVSEICLGTMTFGTPVGRADAIGLCHAAFDAGINFIDTANSYEGYSRVVGSAGALTGYHWGLPRKRAILGWEAGVTSR